MWVVKHKSGTTLFVTTSRITAANRREMGWRVTSMLTKRYRNFFIIRDIVIEDEGYLCADKVIMKYYGRHHVDRIGK